MAFVYDGRSQDADIRGRILQQETHTSGWVNVKSYGTVGDGSHDDAAAIQAAVNAAALVRGTVYLPPSSGRYLIASSVTVPAGVRIVGGGRTTSPTATPDYGSILYYTGNGTALRFDGSLAGAEHLTVFGTASASAGIVFNGDANVIESPYLRHVLIYGFTGGDALYLNGRTQGAVTYGLFHDIRIRNAKTGIHIYDANSLGGSDHGFVNTNVFEGGAISGGNGLFDYAIRVEGGNDNRITGMSVEPYTSTYGHILVTRGELKFDGRIEGTNQPATTPIVDIQSGATGGYVRGLGAAGLVKNAAPHLVEVSALSGKHAEPRRPSANLFPNPSFTSTDATARTIGAWTVTETGGASTWTLGASEIAANHAVIQVSVPAGGTVELKPTAAPSALNGAAICTFGLWVKTAKTSGVYARINAPAGVTTSAFHSGSDTWEPVSMYGAFSGSPDPRFVLDNSGGGAPATYYVTAPYFAFGTVNPDTIADLSVAGGTVYGTLEGGGGAISLPAAGDNAFYAAADAEVTVPKWGNLIHVAGTARTITRLNNVAANRWAKYSLLRLVFDIATVGVTNSGYITLTGAFTSSVGSQLLLESNGDGTWTERDRK